MNRVGVVHCDYKAEDAVVHQAVWRAKDMLDDSLGNFSEKRRIVIKGNIVPSGIRKYEGIVYTLTAPAVLAGVVSWLRRKSPDADIILLDDYSGITGMIDSLRDLGYKDALAEYDVRFVDESGGYSVFDVPGGGIMFDRYCLPTALESADAVVSVAHMKSHMATGYTLTLKNLFGWPPAKFYGYPRRYLHSPVRLPRVLADIAAIVKPCLCVIDGLLASDYVEWAGIGGWEGEPLPMNCILAGHDTVATDATGARLMGFDPEEDYPEFPYYFDSNPLALAAGHGLGLWPKTRSKCWAMEQIPSGSLSASAAPASANWLKP